MVAGTLLLLVELKGVTVPFTAMTPLTPLSPNTATTPCQALSEPHNPATALSAAAMYFNEELDGPGK